MQSLHQKPKGGGEKWGEAQKKSWSLHITKADKRKENRAFSSYSQTLIERGERTQPGGKEHVVIIFYCQTKGTLEPFYFTGFNKEQEDHGGRGK